MPERQSRKWTFDRSNKKCPVSQVRDLAKSPENTRPKAPPGLSGSRPTPGQSPAKHKCAICSFAGRWHSCVSKRSMSNSPAGLCDTSGCRHSALALGSGTRSRFHSGGALADVCGPTRGAGVVCARHVDQQCTERRRRPSCSKSAHSGVRRIAVMKTYNPTDECAAANSPPP